MDSSPPAAVGRAEEIDALALYEDPAAPARRRAAWGGLAAGAVPSALSLLGVLALTPAYMRTLSSSLHHLLPHGVAQVLEATLALSWFALPAAGMALFLPWIRARIRDLATEGEDIGEAGAAGVSMGALVGGGAALGVLAAETTRAAVFGPVALATALGAGVLGAAAFGALPRRRSDGRERALPPVPTTLLAAGAAAPALATWTFAGAWALFSLPGLAAWLSDLFLLLPWAVTPLTLTTAVVLAALPASFLLGRILRRFLPGSSRRAAALGVALTTLVPLLHASRPLFEDMWLLPLAPFLVALAAMVGMGSHATATYLAMGRPRTHDPEHSLPGSTAWRDPR